MKMTEAGARSPKQPFAHGKHPASSVIRLRGQIPGAVWRLRGRPQRNGPRARVPMRAPSRRRVEAAVACHRFPRLSPSSVLSPERFTHQLMVNETDLSKKKAYATGTVNPHVADVSTGESGFRRSPGRSAWSRDTKGRAGRRPAGTRRPDRRPAKCGNGHPPSASRRLRRQSHRCNWL